MASEPAGTGFYMENEGPGRCVSKYSKVQTFWRKSDNAVCDCSGHLQCFSSLRSHSLLSSHYLLISAVRVCVCSVEATLIDNCCCVSEDVKRSVSLCVSAQGSSGGLLQKRVHRAFY